MSAVDIVVITALGIGGLYSGAKKRSQMKKEDEEIKQEASRERNMELEKPSLPDKEHPLKDGTSPVILVRGEFGTDDGLPETVDTFAHRGHGSVKNLDGKLDIFHCSHCNNIGKGFRYRCEFEGCDRFVHPICAKSPTRIHSSMHPEHELELTTRPFLQHVQFVTEVGRAILITGCTPAKIASSTSTLRVVCGHNISSMGCTPSPIIPYNSLMYLLLRLQRAMLARRSATVRCCIVVRVAKRTTILYAYCASRSTKRLTGSWIMLSRRRWRRSRGLILSLSGLIILDLSDDTTTTSIQCVLSRQCLGGQDVPTLIASSKERG